MQRDELSMWNAEPVLTHLKYMHIFLSACSWYAFGQVTCYLFLIVFHTGVFHLLREGSYMRGHALVWCTLSHPHFLTPSYTLTHTYCHTHSYPHFLTLLPTLTLAHTHPSTLLHNLTHTFPHTHSHPHFFTHLPTLTLTHTLTHTYPQNSHLQFLTPLPTHTLSATLSHTLTHTYGDLIYPNSKSHQHFLSPLPTLMVTWLTLTPSLTKTSSHPYPHLWWLDLP